MASGNDITSNCNKIVLTMNHYRSYTLEEVTTIRNCIEGLMDDLSCYGCRPEIATIELSSAGVL